MIVPYLLVNNQQWMCYKPCKISVVFKETLAILCPMMSVESDGIHLLIAQKQHLSSQCLPTPLQLDCIGYSSMRENTQIHKTFPACLHYTC